jgi:ubiquinone/menaquinone biosynthesis C-methylase UbiE
MNASTPNPSPADAVQSVWEAAYQRFETPEAEIRKFVARLRELGADAWSRDAQVVEIFCGRGNGLHALAQFGFTRLEGVDYSPALLARYTGPAVCTVADCRALPFPDASRDILVVQGGLHHLLELPSDLNRSLDEVVRVLRPGGRFMVVEPWLTPFLRVVHAIAFFPPARAAWGKLDALATMIEHERTTYEQWLGQPTVVLESLQSRFQVERCSMSWGKLRFVGRKAGA